MNKECSTSQGFNPRTFGLHNSLFKPHGDISGLKQQGIKVILTSLPTCNFDSLWLKSSCLNQSGWGKNIKMSEFIGIISLHPDKTGIIR